MYTLRTITEQGVESNINLGNSFQVFKRGTTKEETFNTISEKNLPESVDRELCHAVVVTHDGKCLPIFKGQSNYIVTMNGKTFSNLTFK